MELDTLIPNLRKFTKIIVTGPQRSGTTIAARIIAADLGYEEVLEETFDYDDLYKFSKILSSKQSFVVQAPCLSSIAHFLNRGEDVAIVFLIRDNEDIRKSVLRVGWDTYARSEYSKYFRFNQVVPIWELKKDIWFRYQKEALSGRGFELDYESMKGHKMWVESGDRKNFHTRQTSR